MVSVPPCEVVVFDVFDTMVVRPFYGPTDHFNLIEQSSGLKGFVDARIASELYLRKYTDPEINLDEIYSVMPEEYAALKETEENLDIRQCRADLECLELFNQMRAEGRRIIVATDMYHSPETIEQILTRCGYSGWERLYVSGAERLSKRTGDLYKLIISDLNVPASSVTMIGDNPHSDGSSPRRLGINTIRWTPLRRRYSMTHGAESRVAKRCPGLSTVFGTDMLMWQAHPEDDDYWHSVGERFGGPMAVNFDLMVNRITADGTGRILFFARDGYVPWIVYRALFPGDGRTDYLHTSRLISESFRHDHPAHDRNELLSILTYLDEAGYSADLGITSDLPESERLVLMSSKKEEVLKVLERGRENYTRYIRGLTAGETKVTFVDTTTKNFTSQRAIDEFVPGLDSLGIYYAVTGRWDVRQAMYCDRRSQHLVSTYVNIAEVLFAASAAPVRDFSDTGEPLFPRPMNEEEKARAEYAESIFRGELDYVRFFRELWGTETVPFTDGRSMDRWVDALVSHERANRGDESRLGGMKWYVDPSHKRHLHTILRTTDAAKTVVWKGFSLLYRLGIKK